MKRLASIWLAGAIVMILLAPIAQLIPRVIPLPNVALLVTLYVAFAYKGGPSGGAACAGGLGYLADLLSGAPRGTYMLAMMLVFFIIRGLSTRLYVQGKLSQVAVSFAASLFASFLVVAIHVALPPRGAWSILIQAPFEAGVTAAFAPLTFYVLWRFDRRLDRTAATEGVFR